jgi:3'(2'), 5'-bisphosphate nucleotidase
MTQDEQIIDALLNTCADLSREVMAIRASEQLGVMMKDDESPVTRADIKADEMIRKALFAIDSSIPIISEEEPGMEFETRQAWKQLWLVDPIDGTKEYIKGSKDFTLNIARLTRGVLDLAVVVAPAYEQSYFAIKGHGAFSVDGGGARSPIKTRSFCEEHPTVLVSHEHRGYELEIIREVYPNAVVQTMGSSLKFCHLASGKADFYLRLHPTCEWDTAAGQCILGIAGGATRSYLGEELLYNRENIINPPFLAYGDQSSSWRKILETLRKKYEERQRRKSR